MSTEDLLSNFQALEISDNDLPYIFPDENTAEIAATEENMPPTNPPTFDIKNLSIVPEYDGNPNELYEFINSATMLLNYFWNQNDSGCFQNLMLLQGLKTKLTGRAKEITSVYGCLSWDTIKNVLIQNFADQRNENSLTRDLVNLRQTNDSPQQFYEKVMGLLNTISNYIELHHDNEAIKTSKKLFFQQQALTTFLAGLKEPLGSTIRAMRPKDLAAAMQYIQEENNIKYLQKSFSIPQPSSSKPNHQPPRQMPYQPNLVASQSPQWPQFRSQASSPFNQQKPWTSSPFQRPQQQQQSKPFVPAFNTSRQTNQPAIQPARFQPPRPQFNTWQRNPNHGFQQPTPMSTTSRATTKPPQQSTPKFTFEELFNIEQQDEPQNTYNYTDPQTWNDYYNMDQQEDYQQEVYEDQQYTEGENFQEDAYQETKT